MKPTIYNKIEIMNIFKDDNNYDEKNVVGFASFSIMVLFAIADILTSVFTNTKLNVSPIIYNSFVIVTIGSFGISTVDRYFKRRK